MALYEDLRSAYLDESHRQVPLGLCVLLRGGMLALLAVHSQLTPAPRPPRPTTTALNLDPSLRKELVMVLAGMAMSVHVRRTP
jgi:hypothetical protein